MLLLERCKLEGKDDSCVGSVELMARAGKIISAVRPYLLGSKAREGLWSGQGKKAVGSCNEYP